MLQRVLLILPSFFITNNRTKFETSIKERINPLSLKRLDYHNPFYILDVNDVVEAAYQLENLSGIVRISIVQESGFDINVILGDVLDVSKQIFWFNQTFFVDVHNYNTKSLNFLEKDLELLVTSSILSQNKYSLKPATRDKADKIIEIYFSDKGSFISLFSLSSNGGLPCRSYDKSSVCTIYDSLSALSAYLAVKSGMDLEIIVFYYDEQSLKHNLLYLENIINKISYELNIRIIKYNDIFNKKIMRYVFEILSIRIMSKLRVDDIVLSLNTSFHDFAFVKRELNYVMQNGKTPFLPLMMLNDDIFDIARLNGFEIVNMSSEPSTFNEVQDIVNSLEMNIEKLSLDLYKASKIFRLQKGSNYFHDILNSI